MTPIDTTSYRSPNFSSREGADIDMLVLHSGEGTKASDLATLRNDRVPLKQRVSSHYYVDRAGNVYELVDPKYAAWHAGASAWEGRDGTTIMRHSIGIETEHKRGQSWPAVQWAALGQLCVMLIQRYQIPQRFVVAHRWIAPGRKPDPTDRPDALLHSWIATFYAPPRPSVARYQFLVAQAAFTDRRPDARLADGPTVFQPGDIVEIDDVMAGWGHVASGIGFVPVATLRGPL